MKPYGIEIFSNINGMQIIFGRICRLQAAKRAKEAEQKMAREVGKIRSGSLATCGLVLVFKCIFYPCKAGQIHDDPRIK